MNGCFVSDRQPELASESRDRGQVTSSNTADDGPDSGPAAPNADADANETPATGCSPERAPDSDARPSVSDSDGVDDIYLGWTRITLGTAQNSPVRDRLGLDLDHTCTNSPDCPDDRDAFSCRMGEARTAADTAGCRDNALANVLHVSNQIATLGTRFGLSDEALQCGLNDGSFNVIARVRNYNGLPDDPKVRVDWYTAAALPGAGAGGCDGKQRWSRSTVWDVDETQLLGAATAPSELADSRIYDADAYVRGGRLVSRLPAATVLWLNGGPATFRAFALQYYDEAHWLARLDKAPDDSWRMTDGLLAGRIQVDALVRALRETGFCESNSGDLTYSVISTFVRDSADLLSNGESDASRACDAISFGIGFDATQVTPGAGRALPERLECCAPGRTIDECAASCGDGRVSGDEKCDTAIAAGQAGACPSVCPPDGACTPQVVSGSGCSVECVPKPITMVGARDGCCPQDASANTDVDCKAQCGNGTVETGETCDPPSSCKECPAYACAPTTVTGAAESCNLRCEFTLLTACADDDACCPAGCSSQTDGDCSRTCGNGALEPDETCEAGSSRPCPTACDDGKPCTIDVMFGSAATCNVSCMHREITEAANGDACCPSGATPNTDDDCTARCGNRVVEGSEGCDDGNAAAGDGCFECRAENAQQMCLMALGASDACAQCQCTNCAPQIAACYFDSDADPARACANLVECSSRNGCGNPDCYCGTTSLFVCFSGSGNGPCRRENEEAAMSTSIFEIDERSTDLNYPLGRVNALQTCAERNCAGPCGLAQ